jgi:hypothetical protein
LTNADRDDVGAAVARYRAAAGLGGHDRLVWTASPAAFQAYADARHRWPVLTRRGRLHWCLRRLPFALVLAIAAGLGVAWAVVLFHVLRRHDLLLYRAFWVTVSWLFSVALAGAVAIPVWSALRQALEPVRQALGDVPTAPALRVDEATFRSPDATPPHGVGRDQLLPLTTVVPATGLTFFGSGYCRWAPVRVEFSGGGRGRRSRDLDWPELAWLASLGALQPAELAAAYVAITHRIAAIGLFRDLTVVLEPPQKVSTEDVAGGGRRLHSDDGPALEWADGQVHYIVHGVQVTPEVFGGQLSVEQISALPSAELRRIAIERMGWQRWLDLAAPPLIGEGPDPAHPGTVLRLYDVPDADTRLLLTRTGDLGLPRADRERAEPVPARLADPVEAAAWRYGVPVEIYRTLQSQALPPEVERR